LIEKHLEEFAQIESLDNGKPLKIARVADVRSPSSTCATTPAGPPRSKQHDPADPAETFEVSRLHGARTRRRLRSNHSVEFPVADGSMEARSSFGRWLHYRY
jgi:hypothetical protein